jgi:hypothetical protein
MECAGGKTNASVTSCVYYRLHYRTRHETPMINLRAEQNKIKMEHYCSVFLLKPGRYIFQKIK